MGATPAALALAGEARTAYLCRQAWIGGGGRGNPQGMSGYPPAVNGRPSGCRHRHHQHHRHRRHCHPRRRCRHHHCRPAPHLIACGAGGGPCGQAQAATHVLGQAGRVVEARCSVEGIGNPTGEARAVLLDCARTKGIKRLGASRGGEAARGPPQHPAPQPASQLTRPPVAAARPQSAGSQTRIQSPPNQRRRARRGAGGVRESGLAGRCVKTLCTTRPRPQDVAVDQAWQGRQTRRGRQERLSGVHVHLCAQGEGAAVR